MHGFERWRQFLQAAPDAGAVERVIRNYVKALPPDEVETLPAQSRRALNDPDILGAAVTLLHCELAYRGEPASAELLHEIAHTFAAASTRISRLSRDSLAPPVE